MGTFTTLHTKAGASQPAIHLHVDSGNLQDTTDAANGLCGRADEPVLSKRGLDSLKILLESGNLLLQHRAHNQLK